MEFRFFLDSTSAQRKHTQTEMFARVLRVKTDSYSHSTLIIIINNVS